ncbi:TIGR02285 family protein [Desulfobulbus elongatus]|uniref:TIGR02285 family protein n=1 Tax=Desulfobulbus elongatus TaxID=53332 RepID=UPI000A066C01|nr:TIGR02285 family protein [Desulfobulbus elongatus]
MLFRSFPLRAVLPVCLSVGLAAPAWARDSITWMEAVMPPYLIQDGVNKGQGYGDVITRIIQEELAEYEHEEMVTNVTRHFYKFKQGEKVCSVGLFRSPEREEFMYFSLPSFLTLPAVIIIKKKSLPQFGGHTTVRLADVLNNKNMTIGLSKDRSFGACTDEILDNHRGENNLLEITGQELSLNLFKMLMKGRLDGIIGLPEEVLYQAEQLGIRDQVMTLTIEENQTGYDSWLSAVGCAKTPWGKAVIDKVNAVLIKERPTERYRAAYERWLDPNAIEQYRRVYRDVFLKQTP